MEGASGARVSGAGRTADTANVSGHLADAYLNDLKAGRRLAPNTVNSYARDLVLLARFAEARRTRVDGLDRRDLEAFVRELMAAGLAPRSVARTVACVRGFYRFLLVDGHTASNPADDLRPPRSWPALPKFLSIEEVDTLMSQPDTGTAIGIRDRARPPDGERARPRLRREPGRRRDSSKEESATAAGGKPVVSRGRSTRVVTAPGESAGKTSARFRLGVSRVPTPVCPHTLQYGHDGSDSHDRGRREPRVDGR